MVDSNLRCALALHVAPFLSIITFLQFCGTFSRVLPGLLHDPGKCSTWQIAACVSSRSITRHVGKLNRAKVELSEYRPLSRTPGTITLQRAASCFEAMQQAHCKTLNDVAHAEPARL